LKSLFSEENGVKGLKRGSEEEYPFCVGKENIGFINFNF